MRTIIVTAAVVLLATLTGCAPHAAQVDEYSPPAPTQTQGATPEPTTEPAYDQDSTYLSFVRSESVILQDIPDSTILDVAHSYCDLLDAYGDYESASLDMIGMMEEQGITEDIYVPVLGAAVPTYCPQWSAAQQAY